MLSRLRVNSITASPDSANENVEANDAITTSSLLRQTPVCIGRRYYRPDLKRTPDKQAKARSLFAEYTSECSTNYDSFLN